MSNTANGLELDQAEIIGEISVGDAFRVYKHHTIESIFPSDTFGDSYLEFSQIFIYEPDLSDMKINLSAGPSATYVTSNGGRWVGNNVDETTPLPPEQRFILRNLSDQNLRVVTHGWVADFEISMLIAPDGDLTTATGYPVPVPLKDSGLDGDQRRVFLYNKTTMTINRSAEKAPASRNGEWVGNGITGEELLLPSESFTFRLPVDEMGERVSIPTPYVEFEAGAPDLPPKNWTSCG